MAVFLSPVGGVAAQFFDNSGNVLTGGKLYTYSAGTTTPVAAYTSSLGNVAWSNPIVLDASGRVSGGGEIWLTDGVIYKFVLKDSNDVLIATYDNITGINSNFVNYTTGQEIQTATADQTVFTLAGIEYQPGTNNLTVYVDGVNQYGPGAQYSYEETDSTTVTFNDGLHVGASVKFTTATQTTGNATDASVVSYNPPFTGAVGTNVEDKLAQYVSVKDFGAVGDGVADDTAAIQAAIAATVGGNIYFPQGEYKVTEMLVFDNVGILGDGPRGGISANGGTQFTYYGGGSGNEYCMVLNSYRGCTWTGFTVTADATSTGTGGVCVLGTHPNLSNVRITKFDQVALRCGTGSGNSFVPAPTGWSLNAPYYGDFRDLWLSTRETSSESHVSCVYGLINDGGTPSANANCYYNVVINGKFQTMMYMDGTSNTFQKGDIDPADSYTTCAYQINGLINIVKEVYNEVYSPVKFIWFDTQSTGCVVENLQISNNNQPTMLNIVDDGFMNQCDIKPRGYNYEQYVKFGSFQNLVKNEEFRVWDAAAPLGASPEGFAILGGSWTRDNSVVYGNAPYSMTATAAASSFNLAYFVYSTNSNYNSYNVLSPQDMAGKTLRVSCWVKSSVAGLGCVQAYADGSYGQSAHSGSGNWELLIASVQITGAETSIGAYLRNAPSGNSTGQAYFCKPFITLGPDIYYSEPRPLLESKAILSGPLSYAEFVTFADAATTPSVADGNCFNVSNTGSTTITNFTGGANGQIIYLLATNGNTTLKNNTTIKTSTGSDKVLSSDTMYKLVFNGTKWYEV